MTLLEEDRSVLFFFCDWVETGPALPALHRLGFLLNVIEIIVCTCLFEETLIKYKMDLTIFIGLHNLGILALIYFKQRQLQAEQ